LVEVVIRSRALHTKPGVSFGRSHVIVPLDWSGPHCAPGSKVEDTSVAPVVVVPPPVNRSTRVSVKLGCVSDRFFSVLFTVTAYSM
jgi:hypothetical protein